MIPLPPSSIPSNLIRHIHLRGVTPFHIAQTIQSTLVSKLLDHKRKASSPEHAHLTPPSPTPTVLTFQSTPVYTTGRRELQTPLSESLLKTLQEPLIPISTTHLPTIREPFTTSNSKEQTAEVVQTPRGGLITFHGPGQLVIYPIIDLLTFPNLGARCYVNLLEEATIKLLRVMCLDILGRTENPGVWLNENEKIASLGVQLRRNVSSYGVGLNMIMERGWWDRIKACGLDGKRTIGLDEVFIQTPGKYEELKEKLGIDIKMQLMDGSYIAHWWIKEFVAGLGRLERREKCDGSESPVENETKKVENEEENIRKRREWTTWGDVPEEVKQLIPLDIRGGKELNISTGGGFIQYHHWR
ncbi:ec216769-7d59-4f13-952f-1a99e6e500a9 [Sclerotinia trifoliorum]|uniref:lipoyl(octanoyl) transferase n=1 Tax=Sclerotinia trifoliorum TaxID=28548 RepID=A0A8H2VWR7_9HELO|nr:ec216769-7d59-4f13-952f-1a99e6e500a9 [Sclerotinia trifoliorum]